jgi:hypothetical protein
MAKGEILSEGMLMYGLAVLLAFGTSFLAFRAACAVQDARPGLHFHAFQYIKMPPMELKTSSEQAIILVTLEVTAEKKDAMEKLLPQLLEAFTKELSADFPGAGFNNLMQGKTADLSALKERLMKTAEKIAGPGVVEDILLDVQQGRT